MRISDWSSDVCSSDLLDLGQGVVVMRQRFGHVLPAAAAGPVLIGIGPLPMGVVVAVVFLAALLGELASAVQHLGVGPAVAPVLHQHPDRKSTRLNSSH